MTELALRHKTTFLTRCALCGSTRQFFYVGNIGGTPMKFCSGSHLHRAQENYEQNKNKVIPTNEEPTVDYEEGVQNG